MGLEEPPVTVPCTCGVCPSLPWLEDHRDQGQGVGPTWSRRGLTVQSSKPALISQARLPSQGHRVTRPGSGAGCCVTLSGHLASLGLSFLSHKMKPKARRSSQLPPALKLGHSETRGASRPFGNVQRGLRVKETGFKRQTRGKEAGNPPARFLSNNSAGLPLVCALCFLSHGARTWAIETPMGRIQNGEDVQRPAERRSRVARSPSRQARRGPRGSSWSGTGGWSAHGCGGARVATHRVVGSSLFSVWKARSLTQRKEGGRVADVMRLEKVGSIT